MESPKAPFDPSGTIPFPDALDRERYFARDKANDGTFLRVAEMPSEVDPEAGAELVATVWNDEDGRVIGRASYSVDPWTEPRRAEAMVDVAEEWRGRGIGGLLFAHLAQVARDGGVDVLYVIELSPNPKVLRVLQEVGLSPTLENDGAAIRISVDLHGTGREERRIAPV
jgi:GNAT superfamily N-acetyltransferase